MSNMMIMLERPSIRIGGVPPPSLVQDGLFLAGGNNVNISEGGAVVGGGLALNFWFHTRMTVSRTPDDLPGQQLYWEIEAGTSGRSRAFGIRLSTTMPGSTVHPNSSIDFMYRSDGTKSNVGSWTAYGATWTNTDNIACLWDCDSGDITFYKNGISQGVAFTTATNLESVIMVAQVNNGQFARIHPTTQATIPNAGEVQWWFPNPPATVFYVPADANANSVSPGIAATGTLGSQAAISVVESKFGAGSIEFTPSGSVNPALSFVSYPDISDYALSNADFCIEGFVRFKDLTSAAQVMASQYENTGNQRGWYFRRNGGNLQFVSTDDGSTTRTNLSGAVSWVIDDWVHVAITRAADVFRIFAAGIQVGTTTNSFTIFNSSAVLRLGKFRSAGFDDGPMDGFVDDWRIVTGDAVYTSNFTPPTVPHG